MIVVLGATGQVGREIVSQLSHTNQSFVALGSRELDITRPESVHDAFSHMHPTTIFNAAAYTNVVQSETNVALAMKVNAQAPEILALAACAVDARLVHISTDYVFDGESKTPYDIHATKNPLNVYGLSKSIGEDAVLAASDRHCVVRTSWVYGVGGSNFVKAMLNKVHTDQEVNVVCDQFGQPTWAADLAGGLIEIDSHPDLSGIFHFSNEGPTSWYDFALAIYAECGADSYRVHAVPSDEYLTQVKRPQYSVLSHSEWIASGLTPPRHWREALSAANVSRW